MNPSRTVRLFLTAVLLASLFTACTVTPAAESAAGELTETGEPAEAELSITRSNDEDTSGGNLRITTIPSGARIYIDGAERGETPVTLEIPRGAYRLAVEKDLYYRAARWIDIYDPETLTQIEIRLAQKSGTFDPAVIPANSTVRLGGTPVDALPATLPAGTYTVRVEHFGYEPQERRIRIAPGAVASPRFELDRAPFRLENLRVEPAHITPLDPGTLGSAVFRFSLTGPAELETLLRAPDGKPVFRSATEERNEAEQHFEWHPAAEAAAYLPEGTYRLEVEAVSLTGQGTRNTAAELRISHAPRGSVRSGVEAGTPGSALLSPTALLPHAGFGHVSMSSLAGSLAYPDGNGPSQFPFLLTAGWSPSDRHHLGLSGALLLNDTGASSPAAAASYSGTLYRGGSERSDDGLCLSAAYGARYVYHAPSFGLPGFRDGLGAGTAVTVHSPFRSPLLLALSLAPELLVSFGQRPPVWRALLRGALTAETPRWEVALSASLPSAQFGEPFAVEYPFAFAGELRTVIPGSSVALSLLMLSEAGPQELSLYGGLGFQYHFVAGREEP